MFRSQDIIAQRYHLKRTVKSSDALQSWLAHDNQRGIPVISTVCVSNELDAQARFDKASSEMCALTSPFLEKGYDYGNFRGYTFLVTEYLHGHDLAHELTQGRISAGRMLAISHSIASGIEALHHVGMIHGGLSPRELWVSSVERDVPCKILGTARRVGGNELEADYLSPERQLEPGVIDRKDDLWSFAVVVYQCLTGRLPYGKTGATQRVEMARSGQFRPVVGDCAPTLNSWFYTALHPDPESRFTSSLQMVSYLERILARDPAQQVS